MRRLRVLLTWLLVVGTVVVAGAAPASTAAAPAPKVALIVGPVGATTERYRRLADEAAAEARRYTTNLVRVYSPNATWPAVRRALQGASIVIYLGHGNGWPSHYRKSLYPTTQNGFGLNPVGGTDDSSHQYFGEASIAAEVRLAPNAAVLLHHLCYASGNSEPGLPEGGEDVARQRVDNFAAGFLRAGAGAVIAEAHSGPAWYVGQLLGGGGSLNAIWRGSPTFNDHVISFASQRTPGHVAFLDPDRASSGFHRSMVLRPGLGAKHVRGGGPLPAGPVVGLRGNPAAVRPHSLVHLGLTAQAPALVDQPVAGTRTALAIPYRTAAGSSLPADLEVGVRWDPLDVQAPAPPLPVSSPAADPSPAPAAAPAPVASPAPLASPAPVASDLPTPSETAPAAAAEPEPAVAVPAMPRLVVAESPGSVVAPVAARIGRSALALEVVVPNAPGLYRLVTTLHDGSAVAYDAETQARVPALIVRVTAPLDAYYGVAPMVAVNAGDVLQLPVTVTNLGAVDWGLTGARRSLPRHQDARRAHLALVIRWVGLETTVQPGDLPRSLELPLTDGLVAGASASVTATIGAPMTAGEYLLVLDVTLPDTGSLTAAGVPPGLVRVTVH